MNEQKNYKLRGILQKKKIRLRIINGWTENSPNFLLFSDMTGVGDADEVLGQQLSQFKKSSAPARQAVNV